MSLQELEARVALATPIAIEMGLETTEVCRVLLAVKDDPVKASQICELAVQQGISPVSLIAIVE